MEPIRSFQDLLDNYTKFNYKDNQPYFFIFLIRPYQTSSYFDINKDFFNHISEFHTNSIKKCDFFMPGYGNNLDERRGPLYTEEIIHRPSLFENHRLNREHHYRDRSSYFYPVTIDDKEKNVLFIERDFINFVIKVEECTDHRWSYKNQPELVLIKKDREHKSLDLSDILVFNLEDIIRQGHTIPEFVDILINLSTKYTEDKDIKRNIYLAYWNLTMPNDQNFNREYDKLCTHLFFDWYLKNKDYAFISYSFLDLEAAKYLRRRLSFNHINVWMSPDSLPYGVSYQYMISKAIENADTFFLVLSSHSNESVWVEKELQMALAKMKNKKIIVCLLNNETFEENTFFKEHLHQDDIIYLNYDEKKLHFEIIDLKEKGILPNDKKDQ